MGAGFLENCEKSPCCISGLVTGTPSGQTYFHLTKPVYMYMCVCVLVGGGKRRAKESDQSKQNQISEAKVAREERTEGISRRGNGNNMVYVCAFFENTKWQILTHPSCSGLSLHTFSAPQTLMESIQFYSEAGQSPLCLPFPGYKIGTPIPAAMLPTRKPAWFLYESSEKGFLFDARIYHMSQEKKTRFKIF